MIDTTPTNFTAPKSPKLPMCSDSLRNVTTVTLCHKSLHTNNFDQFWTRKINGGCV